MTKIIPILPCANINEQCAFYQSIGFTVTAKYKSPTTYAVVQYADITLHFWGSKKHNPTTNASMIFVEIDDADRFNMEFIANIKKMNKAIPRTGMPRISKVRDLKDDRRFTLCDPAGNTLYFGTPNDGTEIALRTLDNEKYAKAFAVVYDLLHSHEEPEKAAKALSVFMRNKDKLDESDKEKLSVLAAEIEYALKIKEEDKNGS